MFTAWMYGFGYLIYKEKKIAQESPLGGVKKSQTAQIIDKDNTILLSLPT